MMTTTTTDRYYGTAKCVPIEAMMTVGHVLRNGWGDYGYSYGVEAQGMGRYVFCCRHSDGSEWFLESDRYGNVYETENVDGTWIRGART